MSEFRVIMLPRKKLKPEEVLAAILDVSDESDDSYDSDELDFDENLDVANDESKPKFHLLKKLYRILLFSIKREH